jgi:hypothetical protein
MFRFFERLRRPAGPSPSESLTLSAAVTAARHSGGLILLDSETGGVFSVNETGAAMWEALWEGAKPEALGATLAARFGVPEKVAAGDAARFVEALETEGILVRGRAA